MSNNSYNDFKNGIKTDIKETGAGLLIVGGAAISVILILTSLMYAFKSKDANTETRFLVGGIAAITGLLMIFSVKIRTLIFQFFVIALVAIPMLLLIYLVLAFFYVVIIQS
ncbi:hypothetical protein [Mucilaginibacter sp. HD30]